MNEQDEFPTRPQTVPCPECLQLVFPDELTMFGGICEDCSDNLDDLD